MINIMIKDKGKNWILHKVTHENLKIHISQRQTKQNDVKPIMI